MQSTQLQKIGPVREKLAEDLWGHCHQGWSAPTGKRDLTISTHWHLGQVAENSMRIDSATPCGQFICIA